MGPPSLFIIVSILITSACAQSGPTSWTATPFNPPAFPLAVKTPYVNTWAPQGNEPKAISNVWTRYGSNLDIPTVWQVKPLIVRTSLLIYYRKDSAMVYHYHCWRHTISTHGHLDWKFWPRRAGSRPNSSHHDSYPYLLPVPGGACDSECDLSEPSRSMLTCI